MPDTDIYASSPLFRLRGTLVASATDEHGEVSVIDNKAFRVMSFDRVFEQSKMHKDNPSLPVHNYIRAMLMAVALAPTDCVLILGLGGGCLVRSLAAHNPQIAADVVELRQAVLSIAHDYFHLPASPSVHYHVQDAARFLDAAEDGRYSLIFSDLYSANALEPLQCSGGFLRNCARKLRPGGWLVLNHPRLPVADEQFSHLLRAIFACLLYTVAPSGNVVIFASPLTEVCCLTELRQRMKACGNDFASDVSALANKLSYWPGAEQKSTAG